MGTNAFAGDTPERAGQAGFDRGAAITRSLLGYGVLAGPFYLIVSLVQAFVRDGFDLTRHALSILANGPGGWVQVANLFLSGLMVIAASIGMARVLQGKAPSIVLAGYGVGMVVAAVFKADPMDGFPVGTPLGHPTSVSTSGLIHFAAGGLGFTLLGISGIVMAVALSRRGDRMWSRISLVSGIAVLLGFFGGFALGGGSIAGIWFAVVVGWAWLAALSLHLYRVAPDPDCAP